MLLELDALVGQHPSHVCDLLFAAPVESKDFTLVGSELVLRAAHDTEVRIRFLVDPNRNLQFGELGKVLGVLHLLQHNAFLHLSDILLHDDLIELL